MYALLLNEKGMILSATSPQFAAEGMPIVDHLPEGDISEYRYNEDGTYTRIPRPPEPDPGPADAERLDELELSVDELTLAVADLIGGAM